MKMYLEILLLWIVIIIPNLSAAECHDTFSIDSILYRVPQWWCERQIDDSEIAEPSELVRIPERLCHRDFKIYVRAETRDNLVRMADAALADSIHLTVKSGFRSLWYQRRMIKKRLDEGIPIDRILRIVAPPGYSEHHTGRAVDLVGGSGFFGNGPEYKWLKNNAAKFGFIESFPKDSTSAVHWEPWHWCYHIVKKDGSK